MMQSFVDNKYLLHFFNALLKSDRFSNEAEIREEILSFFKSKTNISLEADFETMLNNLDKKSVQIVLTLINKLTTGRNGTTIKTKCGNTFRELKRVEVYSKLKNPFASFWLGNSYNHSLDKYSKANPYYFLSNDDDLNKWKEMSKTKSFYVGPKNNSNSIDSLKDWSQLSTFSHPFKDIIISDRYCLKDKVGIKLNIIPIIQNLAEKTSKIENIIFFTGFNELINNSISDAYELIKGQLDEIKINYTNLIIYHSNLTPHTRCIITNNFFIKSDDSLDYFNSNGKYKTKGSLLTIAPVFKINKSEFNDLIYTWSNILNNSRDEMKYGNVSNNFLDLISRDLVTT
ncbi:hypothetical protein EV196_101727 [Mariniflexile fucanivorans]|uniref:Uncharacterized protein n=1 Tax=Mariniflexile fucanivorans TaxID=264023 RepID=A0A4R1RSJ2_9FLAO|nr:hypothetical protein [Mariniflexile fucanivorans]TCL69289.1 hypothetical protein EV196_101727 [Mariniflexile fucanivorans]